MVACESRLIIVSSLVSPPDNREARWLASSKLRVPRGPSETHLIQEAKRDLRVDDPVGDLCPPARSLAKTGRRFADPPREQRAERSQAGEPDLQTDVRD